MLAITKYIRLRYCMQTAVVAQILALSAQKYIGNPPAIEPCRTRDTTTRFIFS
jgi:hypothetical protein